MDLITGLLALIILTLLVIQHLERRDMLDRLMAKTFTEYKDTTKPEKNELTEEEDGTVPLEAAEDDLLTDDGQEH